MTGRWTAVFKSPLTGGWGDANCGGNLSPAIKRCGFDAIFINGISDRPVYLYIDNETVEIRNADHLWGKDAVESEEILIQECRIKKKPAVAVIGQSGEKLSLISGISNDLGRIAARSGGGAVMGSKKLKGIVLCGSGKIICRDPKKMKVISKELALKIKNQNLPGFMGGWTLPILSKLMGASKNVSAIDGIMAAGIFKKWGTIFNNTMGMENGDCPVKNWNGSVKDFGWWKYRQLNPDRIMKKQSKNTVAILVLSPVEEHVT